MACLLNYKNLNWPNKNQWNIEIDSFLGSASFAFCPPFCCHEKPGNRSHWAVAARQISNQWQCFFSQNCCLIVLSLVHKMQSSPWVRSLRIHKSKLCRGCLACVSLFSLTETAFTDFFLVHRFSLAKGDYSSLCEFIIPKPILYIQFLYSLSSNYNKGRDGKPCSKGRGRGHFGAQEPQTHFKSFET